MDQIMEGKDSKDGNEVSEIMDESLLSSVFSNPVILTTILRSLPPQSLKEYRLVNRMWDEEAGRLYFRTITLEFILDRWTKPNSRFVSGERQSGLGPNFPNKLELLKKFQIKSLYVDISAFQIQKDPTTMEALAQIDDVMETCGPKLKYLTLCMNLADPVGKLIIMAKIFKNLSKLEEIVLDLNVGAGLWLVEHGYQSIPPLPTVRSVKILPSCFQTRDVNYGLFPSNVTTIMGLFPNVNFLAIHQPYVILTLLRLQDCNLVSLDNLRGMDIQLTGTKMTTEILSRIGTLPHGLEILNIKTTSSSAQILRVLEDVLRRHAPTLRSVELQLFENWSEEMQLNFPNFPHLRKLEIWISNFKMSLIFPTGPISYAVNFPKLEELNIRVIPEMCAKPHENLVNFDFIKHFLLSLGENSEGQCLKMRKVDFVIPENWRTPDNLDLAREVVEMFKYTFPNVTLIPLLSCNGF